MFGSVGGDAEGRTGKECESDQNIKKTVGRPLKHTTPNSRVHFAKVSAQMRHLKMKLQAVPTL
jgi:hypothetical protein